MSNIRLAGGRIDFDSFRARKPYIAFTAYAQSKLGNLLYSNALARRTKVPSNAIHPGAVASPLYRELPSLVYASFRWVLIAPEKAGTLIWLAGHLANLPEWAVFGITKDSIDLAIADRIMVMCAGRLVELAPYEAGDKPRRVPRGVDRGRGGDAEDRGADPTPQGH